MARVYEVGSLRTLARLFDTRVRGYIGAAKYLSSVIRRWVDIFEELLSRDGAACNSGQLIPGCVAERLGPHHHPLPVVNTTTQQQSPMGRAFNLRPRFSDQWSPSSALQLFPMFQQDPMTEYSLPFQGTYHTPPEPMDLALTTAVTDFQGTYNWLPPQQWLSGLPSAAVDGTDFSGADMFNLDSEYGTFEVGDLLLPPWMAAQGTPYPPS